MVRSAGVDGETFADIERYGVARWLGELAWDLKDGIYAPKPVLQVLIPRKQPGKLRPLGIPCIRDPLAQTSALLVLEPIFEADLQLAFHYRGGGSEHRFKTDQIWSPSHWRDGNASAPRKGDACP